MENKIKISVIIPNFNNSKFIKECIMSVINQSLLEIEVIIIDDGSSDNSLEIIQNIIKNNKNKNISLIKQFNQNGAVARNRGLEIAKGEYVYFLDSDDCLFDNNVFYNIINQIEDSDLLIGNYQIVDENGEKKGEYNNKNVIIDCNNEIYKYSNQSPVPSNKLYKKDIIDKYNLYFDNVRIGQDLNFYLKYLAVCKKIKSVETQMYKYRIVSTSMTRTKNFNFFDITTNFEYIKKFYIKNSYEEEYYKFLSFVELRHYEMQMLKIKKYKDLKTKKMIYKYFKYFVKQINLKKYYDQKIIKKEYLKYKIKCLIKFKY